MAIITAHFLSGSEALGTAFHREGLVHLDLAQRGSAIIGTVAVRTGGEAGFRGPFMTRNPALTDGMQTMRAAIGGQGHGLVARRTFIDGAGMSLNRQALHVIVSM